MKVTILNVAHDLPVTTVVLAADPLDPMRLSAFHCSGCGSILAQHMGHVVRIIPGASPVELPILVYCPTCKRRYLMSALV